MKTFTRFTYAPYDPGPYSQASMSLLDPRRFKELMLAFFLLSWMGQRVSIYLLYKVHRSLAYHIVPTLAVSFLASQKALRERKGEELAAHTQPALRTGLMAPAWRLLHVSRRVIPDFDLSGFQSPNLFSLPSGSLTTYREERRTPPLFPRRGEKECNNKK